MRFKRLLTAIAALTVGTVLLTGCSAASSENEDGTTTSDETEGYLTVYDFTSEDEELQKVENISALFSRFNIDSSLNLYEDLIAASTASYLDNTAYNFYFMADWWGEKDDFSDKGFQNFSGNITNKMLDEIKTLNKDKDKTPLGSKYFFHQPDSITSAGYRPSDECFDNWEAIACMNPTITESIKFLSANETRAIVEVTSEFTVYLVDEFGSSVDQKVTYSAKLVLDNNRNLTDISEQPFFIVSSVEGGFTYSEPTPANPASE